MHPPRPRSPASPRCRPDALTQREDRISQLFAGAGCVVVGCLPGFSVAALATSIGRDFAFDKSDLGLAVAIFYSICALISPRSGRVVARLGPGRGVWIGVVCTIAGCLVIAASDSTPVLIAGLVVSTVGNAFGAPVASALFQSELAPSRHGMAFGVLQSGAPVGALLAGLMLPFVAIPFGWRWVFVVIAAGALVVGLSVRPRVRASEEPHSTVDSKELPAHAVNAVRGFGLVAGLATAAPVALLSFLVVFATSHGIDEGVAGLLLGAVSALSIVTRVWLGVVMDRTGSAMLGVTAAMMAASVLGYFVLISGEPAGIVAGALIVGLLGWSWPGPVMLKAVRLAPGTGPRAIGTVMAGLFTGAVLGPLAAGFLSDHGGFGLVWGMCVALAFAAAGVTLYLRRQDTRQP